MRIRHYLGAFIMSVAAGSSTMDDPQAILKSTDAARGGGLPGITWTVRVSAIDGGATQQRELTVHAAGSDSLLEFLAPPKVKGQKMLMVGRNTWFVQPGLQRPIPISPRQRLTGQAANGDIASTNYAGDYTATLAREETFDGSDCLVLDLKATNKSATYDRILYWVSKPRHLGIKAEFFTVSGMKFKTAVFDYGNRVSYDGRTVPFISRMVITDAVNQNNVTTLEYSDVRVRAIPASEFSINLLVR